MAYLSKLKLSASSPQTQLSPLDRKRQRLLQRLETQLEAAEAELRGEYYTEEIQRWVKHKETGEKTLVTQQRPIKRWWWQDQNGKWVITLRDGNKVLPIHDKTPSIEVGSKDQLTSVLQAIIEAVKAGELDARMK